MSKDVVKLVVYVPETHADIIREVIARIGAGQFPHYSHCSFSVKGVGRFLPLKGAHPYEEVAFDVYPKPL